MPPATPIYRGIIGPFKKLAIDKFCGLVTSRMTTVEAKMAFEVYCMRSVQKASVY